MPVGPAAWSSAQGGPPLHRTVTWFSGRKAITPAHHAAGCNATRAREPMPDCPPMICEGCGADVDSAFCPSCGRRMRPTDGLVAEPELRYRVVHRRHMSTTRLWLLRVSALFLLVAGVALVVASVSA